MNNSTGPVADYTSIQAAVDAANDGDTIIVYSGTYTENVDVNKELTIISQSGNPEDTVVNPLVDYDYLFHTTANNVTISGFKLGGNGVGICLDRVRYNNISNNKLSGISLKSSSDNTVRNNICSRDYDCLSLSGSDNNLVINNSFSAMDIAASLDHSDNNILTGNSIGAEIGLQLSSSRNNTVINNSIGGLTAILFYPSSNNNTVSSNYLSFYEGSIVIFSSSNNNVIYNNYFDGYGNAFDGGNNIWNITKTPGTNIIGGPFLGGNYWPDYEGIDINWDGLGDTLLPYNFEGKIASGGDYLPLVIPVDPSTVHTVNNSTGPVADYTSIQAAVDAAKDGENILVYSGIYTENVDVNKELTIISQFGNPEDTIVQALDKYDRIFNVTANNVTISGFKVEGSYSEGIYLDEVQHNNIINNKISSYYGISLNSSSNNTLSKNICENYLEGIRLGYSDNNLLSNNSVQGHEAGCIDLIYSDNNILKGNSFGESTFGIYLSHSNNNMLSNNSGVKNYDEAFRLFYSSNNTLSNNYVSDGYIGILLVSSTNNILSSNYAELEEAIKLYNSIDNVIYNNYFNSTSNAYDDGDNIWNITKTEGINIVGGPFLGGNYWSDYAGADTDRDDLGDTLIPYNSGGQITSGGDYLPLVIPADLPATVYTVSNSTGPAADYTSIQAAVDAARNGDTIIVYSGIYKENINVNRELTIISQSGNPEDTIVRVLDKDDYIFEITADNVTVSGFKIEGDETRGLNAGIHLDEVQYNNICNNELVESNIVLSHSDNNIVSDNSVEGVYSAINLDNSNNNIVSNNSVEEIYSAIDLYNSNNNMLTGNNVAVENSGLYWGISLDYSSNNIVSNNYVGSSDCAISLGVSDYNVVSNNHIGSSDWAISLLGSGYNVVNNNYVNNSMLGIVLNFWSENNKVSNNCVNSSSEKAISLNEYCDNNAVSNNTLNSNYTCFYLVNSNDNILTGNIAKQIRSEEGKENIYLSNSDNNVIYNNYFNGTNNAYDDGNNIWNITKTPGTNIVGGPFLGGNYWSDYAGNDTDWDGLGNTLLPYNSEGQIASGGDYLPLVTPAGPAQAIQATVDINPGVLNPKSEGKWVTVYIELPEGYDVNDIDVSTVLLMGSLPAESVSPKVGDGDCNGKPDLMVKFDRKELISIIGTGDVEITVIGELTDGTMFEGTDTIRVLTKVK